MSSTDETKPAAKSGRRNKKGEALRQKSNSAERPAPVQTQTPELEQAPVAQPDPLPAFNEPLDTVVAEAMVAEADPPSPTEPAAAEPSPVSLQTIANAYRDYTRKSFEEFGSFFEQLSGARSLDKAMEVQTEFVKRAYESSVAESRKIRELHGKLARQTLEPFGGLVGKAPEGHGKS
jgi:hypothetical protein